MKKSFHAGHKGTNYDLAVLNVLFEDNVGMKARIALADHACRYFRQYFVQRFGDIHRRFSRLTLASMPARSEPGLPWSSTVTSIVLLAGSTTGLTSTTLTCVFLVGKIRSHHRKYLTLLESPNEIFRQGEPHAQRALGRDPEQAVSLGNLLSLAHVAAGYHAGKGCADLSLFQLQFKGTLRLGGVGEQFANAPDVPGFRFRLELGVLELLLLMIWASHIFWARS